MQRGKRGGGAFYVAFDKENFYLFVKIFLKNKKADQMIGFFYWSSGFSAS